MCVFKSTLYAKKLQTFKTNFNHSDTVNMEENYQLFTFKLSIRALCVTVVQSLLCFFLTNHEFDTIILLWHSVCESAKYH